MPPMGYKVAHLIAVWTPRPIQQFSKKCGTDLRKPSIRVTTEQLEWYVSRMILT